MSLPARAAVGAFAGLLSLSLFGAPARVGDPAPLLVELVLIVLGLWLLARAARRVLGAGALAAMPLRVAIVLLIAIAVGQIARTKKAFPFMPYTMYGRARGGDAVFYRYSALRASGASVPFQPALALPVLANGRLAKGLHNQLDAIASLKAAGRSAIAEERRLEDVLRALIAHQERGRGDDPVVALEVQRMTLAPPYARDAIRRQSVMRFRLGAAP